MVTKFKNPPSQILQAALNYAARGFSVIPIKPKNKKPFIKWEPYQKQRATEEEIRKWWTKWPAAMIGIVTGNISKIDVMDTDTQEADDELQTYLSDSLICPTQRTPGEGKHYLFTHREGIRNSNDRSPFKFHVRGEGGYFIAPPSKNAEGGCYRWLDGLSIEAVDPPPMPDRLYNVLLNSYAVRGGVGGDGAGGVQSEVQSEEQTRADESRRKQKMFEDGVRDNGLFHTANCLVKGGMPKEEISQVLEAVMSSWGEGYDQKWREDKIESALKRAERRERNIAQEVRDWVNESRRGQFESRQIRSEAEISSKEGMHAINDALRRLVEEGVIERYGDKRGVYRCIEKECEDIDFLNASSQTIDIKWPLGIERYIITLPKNVMVIAGSKDAGKTAYLLNLVRLNMNRFPIHYFSSEMGRIELRKRLEKFDLPLEAWQFNPKERSTNFADVIQPNDINVIDYLEVSEDFYRVGGMLREIYEKLDQGIAIVALQKNKGRDTGVGGDRSLEKPRLYLSLENGKAKIIVGKNWASEVNPVGLQLDFKLVQGCKFIPQGDWHK